MAGPRVFPGHKEALADFGEQARRGRFGHVGLDYGTSQLMNALRRERRLPRGVNGAIVAAPRREGGFHLVSPMTVVNRADGLGELRVWPAFTFKFVPPQKPAARR